MKQEKLIIRYIICLVLGIILLSQGKAYSQDFGEIRVTSPPVSIGSGARALGMGGAFIAVADDATAASWNPGGLGQLQRPEISIVGSYFSRREKYNDYVTNKGSCEISSFDLNYLSAAYAKNIWRRNIFFSFNYQKLFDFGREITFDLFYPHTNETQRINFQQEGSLYTFSPALAIEFKSGLYIGFTHNFWSDHITKKSQWTSTLKSIWIDQRDNSVLNTLETNLKYKDFRANSWTWGFLWKVTPRFHLGGVYKTPFRAKVKCEYEILQRPKNYPYRDPNIGNFDDPSGKIDYQIDFPVAYGLGFSFRIGDAWTVAGDITRTEWKDYIITDPNGKALGPFAGSNGLVPHKDATHTVRLGVEYVRILSKIILPFRCGVFYDPEPSIEAPQDSYGMSLGCGIVTNQLAIDFSYQYRFGNDVDGNELGMTNVPIKGKIRQHSLLSSLIFYF